MTPEATQRHPRVNILQSVADASARSGRKPRVACFGLAFKPGINDLRESPALHITLRLQAQGYDVVAVEPNISVHNELSLVELDEALATSDALAVLVSTSSLLRPQPKRNCTSPAPWTFAARANNPVMKFAQFQFALRAVPEMRIRP